MKKLSYLKVDPDGELRAVFEEDPEPSRFYRLTYPFYVLFLILCLLAQPIKRSLTGQAGYPPQSPMARFICSWQRKLNLE